MTELQWKSYDRFVLIFPFFGITVFVIPLVVNLYYSFNSMMLIIVQLVSSILFINGIAFLYHIWGSEYTVVELGGRIRNADEIILLFQSVLNISRVNYSLDFIFTSRNYLFQFDNNSRKRVIFMTHDNPDIMTVHLSKHAFEYKNDIKEALLCLDDRSNEEKIL